MSKTTDYLVSVIAQKEQIIQALMNSKSEIWNTGWDACRDEFDAQKADPTHPIRRNDPYANIPF